MTQAIVIGVAGTGIRQDAYPKKLAWRIRGTRATAGARPAAASPPGSFLERSSRHLLNMAVPANEVVNLATLGAEGPLDDYRRIQEDGPLRDALHGFGWLPTHHGALMQVLPVREPKWKPRSIVSTRSNGGSSSLENLLEARFGSNT